MRDKEDIFKKWTAEKNKAKENLLKRQMDGWKENE